MFQKLIVQFRNGYRKISFVLVLSMMIQLIPPPPAHAAFTGTTDAEALRNEAVEEAFKEAFEEKVTVPMSVYEDRELTEEEEAKITEEVMKLLESTVPLMRPNEVIVRYRGNELPQIITPLEGEDVPAAVVRLRQDPDVLYAEPNYVLTSLLGPVRITESPFDQSEHGEIEVPGAWRLAQDLLRMRTEPGNPAQAQLVTVAVIDSGVDKNHVDLTGRVLSGFNTVNAGADDEATVDNSDYGQGTMVAGIISAVPDNNLGITGAMGDFPINILPIKALDDTGAGSVFQVAKAIRLAADNGARVINLSLGARLPEEPEVLAEAVAYARDQGAIVVAAAGDDGGDVSGFYPADLPGVISVALLFSNYIPPGGFMTNSGASLVAYGDSVNGTLPNNRYGKADCWSDLMTSSALSTPFVSAAAALIFSIFPELTRAEAEEALLSGKQVVFRSDDNASYKFFSFSSVRALFLASNPPRMETTRVSRSTTGTEADYGNIEPAISADGRYVAFTSFATNLVTGDTDQDGSLSDVFVYDRNTDQTCQVSRENDGTDMDGVCSTPVISSNGRFVAFTWGDYYGINPSQIMVHDRDADGDGIFDELNETTTSLVSIGFNNGAPDGSSRNPAISGDGRYIAFESNATNLVENDDNFCWDIFVFDRHTESMEIVSVNDEEDQGDRSSYAPSLNSDGRYVAFESDADNLISDDTNDNRDNLRLHLDIPAGAELVPGSVVVDGLYELGSVPLMQIGHPQEGRMLPGSVYEIPLGDLVKSEEVNTGK